MTRRAPAPIRRGQTLFADIPGVGRKPFVVVSNNSRNRALPSWIGARITSAPRPLITSIVPLAQGDPLRGSVICDDLFVIKREHIHHAAGALSEGTMRRVDSGLKVALALS